MTDLRQCNRVFLTEFIQLYQSFPCLWRVKSREYSDRNKKSQAYDTLVEKYKEVDASASRDSVTKKINSMRTVYRKELAKFNKSIRSGAGEEDIYRPTLWYFEMFGFLGKQETPWESRSTLDDLEEVTKKPQDDINVLNDTFYTPTAPQPTPGSSATTQGRKRNQPTRDKAYGRMELVGHKMSSLREEDTFDIFGKHIANKLRGLERTQNIFAQKLINDVIFDGEMGKLRSSYSDCRFR